MRKEWQGGTAVDKLSFPMLPCTSHGGEDTGAGNEDVEPEDRGVRQHISCHPILL